MSLQTDARDCLRAAIASNNGVDVPPSEWGTVKPSDPTIGAQDGTAWLGTLNIAADCLRAKGYPTRHPTLDKANSLVGKVLTASQMYLVDLSEPQQETATVAPGMPAKATTKGGLLLWGGAAAVVIGTIAMVAHHYSRNGR